jgi:hypothetical protein
MLATASIARRGAVADTVRGQFEMNATYGFAYSGSIGVGAGIFKVTGSDIVGQDYAGVTYRGQVLQDHTTGELDVFFEMTAPPGPPGASPHDLAVKKGVFVRVPPEFGDGKPFEINMPPGPVTLMVKRVSDELAWMADGFMITIEPKPRT